MSLKAHLAAAEKLYICDVLTVTKGCVAKAARVARVSRVQLHRLIARHDIVCDDFRPGKAVVFPVSEMLKRIKQASRNPVKRQVACVTISKRRLEALSA